MHETAIASNILRHIDRKARELQHPCRVAAVSVLVGRFRNVDPESLSFAFDTLKQDYPICADCRLTVIPVEVVALCRASSHRYHLRCEEGFKCGQCGSGIGRLISGDELDIVDITMGTTDTAENNKHARLS